MVTGNKRETQNYLLKDIPDFNCINSLFKTLHKRSPTLSEVKDLQKLWISSAQIPLTSKSPINSHLF